MGLRHASMVFGKETSDWHEQILDYKKVNYNNKVIY